MKTGKENILRLMENTGLIPVFFHPDGDKAAGIVHAAYEGGVRVFEFTNRGPNAFETFQRLRRDVAKYPDAVLGIGTIMNNDDARRFIEAGADFIVSPVLKASMAEECHKQNIMWIPGCGTLTEIVGAHAAGADVVKLFPGVVLGPRFVAAVKPVVPSVRLMPTGGVEPTLQNITEWFSAGVFCVGLGSQLITREMVEHNRWTDLTHAVREVSGFIRAVRKSNK